MASDDEIDPEFLKVFEAFLLNPCACPDPPDASIPYCPQCGNANGDFRIKAMVDELGCKTHQEAMLKECPIYHTQEDLKRFPFCPMCGTDLRKEKIH